MKIDLNADFGEGIQLNGQSADELIILYITSANIACGYHAGDESTMRKAIALCIKHNVNIGAHPSYNDKVNFGRIESNDTPEQIYNLTYLQLTTLQQLCHEQNVELHHIKPHGALYHRLIHDSAAAEAFLRAVDAVQPNAKITAFPNSELLRLAGKRGQREAFIDRTYTADGQLTPRTVEGAVIAEPEKAAQQALTFVQQQRADTLCIHGDSPKAIEIAKVNYVLLKREGVL